MKHTLKITLILVAMFLAAQLLGLVIVKQYLSVGERTITDPATGQNVTVTDVGAAGLPYQLERPDVSGIAGIGYILAAILVGTVLFLLLIRIRTHLLWKFWFYMAVSLCLLAALAPFMPQAIALALGLALAYFKVFRQNFYIHNATELLIYGGLAAIFAPAMGLIPAIILLVAISIYDMIAVWKSKHMITLAKAQADQKVFAGMLIPYKMPSAPKAGGHTVSAKVAMLGGGDIGLPLIFAAVVMKGMMLTTGNAIIAVLPIPMMASVALLLLFLKSEKGKFYPAMPFLTIGCAVGWLLTLIYI